MVTIARSPPKGITIVVGVLGAGRVATHWTPSSASIARTMSPADVVAERRGDRGRRARAGRAPTAVIAPPPGERRSSAANRSSPSVGQRLQPDERQVEEDGGGDDEVGHGRPRITGVEGHATSARITSPVSSAFVTKPRAPDSATSEPKSEPSRLEASTIAVRDPALAQPRGDLEPVDVRQLDVEQHDVGRQTKRLLHRGLAVARGPDDREPVRLEHGLRHDLNDGWSSTIRIVIFARI